MFKIPINVPRVFYLNSKAPVTEEFPGRRVKKILPHGRPCFNLIEVVTTEEQFRAEGKKLAAHLAEPDVEWTNLRKNEVYKMDGILLSCR
nr:unnamed protein product [Digitaria exilis]